MITTDGPALRWAVHLPSWQPQDREWVFLKDIIGADERKQVEQFRFHDDKKRAVISRLLKLACVHHALDVAWEEVTIRYTKGNKPYYRSQQDQDKFGAPNFNFNVSHEGDYVVLASEPLCVCGIDVAAPQQARSSPTKTFQELYETFRSQISRAEWQTILRSGHDDATREEAFQQYWSLKEAFAKARGDGLGFDFSRASFTIHPGHPARASVAVDGRPQPLWRFQLQRLGDRHWVSVARGPVQDIVDAWQGFTATLQHPCPSWHHYQVALTAPWPAFQMLSVGDLLPAHLKEAYREACSPCLRMFPHLAVPTYLGSGDNPPVSPRLACVRS
ncbi:hypothetical protein WJX73_000595 [Symbiochloris irregularis]|uniref:holo-[acyl-carrier-protein] synthase n=1 Tax=Symbiochloris irregularis TaxID=706552 RepID=A0AAW1P6Q8_9CHLO